MCASEVASGNFADTLNEVTRQVKHLTVSMGLLLARSQVDGCMAVAIRFLETELASDSNLRHEVRQGYPLNLSI